jgi:outer membrane receptor protein involved in Fe transport
MKPRQQVLEVPNNKTFIDLGLILLSENATKLNEVEVVAQRPLVKVDIDKLVYSAKDDPEASTSNVLDMLRKVPMVTVDGEDNIQLKGSSSYKIYLNGKPSNMISSNPSQVLKSMPANTVKNIEVITEPGAKYDAEGVGGIINIITEKRSDDGYSGSVGANTDTYGGYGLNGNAALKYGKFGFNGYAGYNHFRRPKSESSYIREDFDPSPINNLTQNGKTSVKGNHLYFNLGLSYELDTLNLFNVSVSRFGGKFTSDGYTNAKSAGTQNYGYNSESSSTSEFGGIDVSADYQRTFKKKDELLTISYRYEENPNNLDYETHYYDVTGNYFYAEGYRQKSKNKAGGSEQTGQIDYANPLDKNNSIEAGLKFIYRDNTSRGNNTYYDVDTDEWKNDASRKNDLDHTQSIFAGYVGYGYKTGKFGVKAGLRGEYTDQNIHFMSINDTTIQNNFFDLVPSLTVSYQLGMTQTLKVGYNMRISRPGIWYLNPYVNDLNPTNISYGNPKLNSEQTHNFNLSFGTFSQKVNLNATLNYDYTKNAITSYSFVKDGVTNNTYGNIGKNQNIGLNLYASWTPITILRLNANTNFNYTNIESSTDNNLKNSGFAGHGFAGAMLTLPNDFRIGANAGVFSSRIQLQTKQSAYYFYSFNVLKSFLNKKMDVNLSVSNPFSEYLKFKSTTTGEGFRQKVQTMQPMRSLNLRISYRFGELKSSIKKVQRTISNDDLKNDAGSSQGAGTTQTTTTTGN